MPWESFTQTVVKGVFFAQVVFDNYFDSVAKDCDVSPIQMGDLIVLTFFTNGVFERDGTTIPEKIHVCIVDALDHIEQAGRSHFPRTKLILNDRSVHPVTDDYDSQNGSEN